MILCYCFTESFQEYLKNPPKDYPELTGTNLSNEFQQLKEDLAFYNKQLSREIGDHDKILELVKSLIQAAIENALKTGEELDSVKRQMNSLCYITVSVPTRLSEWAVQEVNNVYERLSSRCDASNAKLNMPLTQESKENSSLFSDETLYHSSVCCLAVNKCSASNFRDTLNVSGHHLQAASMTIFRESLTDRSLIAFQGNVMYVAFQSEPTIAHWLQSSYSSFEEGERYNRDYRTFKNMTLLVGTHYRMIENMQRSSHMNVINGIRMRTQMDVEY